MQLAKCLRTVVNAIRLGLLGFVAACASASAQPYGYLSSVPSAGYIQVMPVNGTTAVNIPLAVAPDLSSGTPLVVNRAGTLAYTEYGSLSPGGPPSGGIVVTSLTSGANVANVLRPAMLSGLALSPNGANLYAFGQSATGYELDVIDTGTLEVLNTVALPNPGFDSGSPGGAMAISTDGKTLYISSALLYVVTTSTLQVSTIAVPDNSFYGIALSPDGSQLWASVSEDYINIYDTGTLAVTATVPTGGGTSLLFAPDGASVIATGNTLQSINATTFQIQATASLAGEYASPGPETSSFLMTNGTGGRTFLVDYQTLAVIRDIPQLGWVSGTAALPGQRGVMTVNAELSAIQVFDPATVSVVGQIPAGAGIKVPAVDATGETVYAPANLGNRLVKIDATTRAVTGFVGDIDSPFAVVVSPDGKTAYAFDYGGDVEGLTGDVVYVVDTQTDSVIQRLTNNGTNAIAISKDSSTIFMAVARSYGKTFSNPDCPLLFGTCVFDRATFSLIAQLDLEAEVLVTSQDGTDIYAIEGGPQVSVLDTATLQVSVINLPDGFIADQILINPTGHSALMVGQSGSAFAAYVFDTSSNQLGAKFPLPVGCCFSEAFAPDGASIWLLSLGQDPPNSLVGESFPGGTVIGQMQTGATWIAFRP